MKLISYTVNNNKFILLENIVIKIVKNKYNIYLNDTLYYSYNKKYFLKFIEENYNKYYDKINDLLSNKIKGGASGMLYYLQCHQCLQCLQCLQCRQCLQCLLQCLQYLLQCLQYLLQCLQYLLQCLQCLQLIMKLQKRLKKMKIKNLKK